MCSMDTEKCDLSYLNVFQIIVNDVIEKEAVNLDESDLDFSIRVENAVVSIIREIENKQLHLFSKPSICINQLQTTIVQLSEDCKNFLDLKASELSERASKIEILINSIYKLLNVLREDYRSYFNFQMKVPAKIKNDYNLVLAKQWNKLLLKFKNLDVDKDLLYVLSTYHNEMQTLHKLTFYELEYWESLIKALSKIDLKVNPDIEFNLFYQFCYLNFNYHPLFQYCMNKVQRDYNQVDSYREEFIKIVVQLRTLNQFSVKPNYGYDLNAQPLKILLCGILKNELVCIKKLLHVNLKTLRSNGAKFFLRQFYFRISISMEQFLFIFRLFIDKGIVMVKRKADLYEFIHNHVGTAKKDNLSIGNMQNTYAENNRNTALKVKAILQSLILHIDQKYLILYLALYSI